MSLLNSFPSHIWAQNIPTFLTPRNTAEETLKGRQFEAWLWGLEKHFLSKCDSTTQKNSFQKIHLLFLNLLPLDWRIKLNGFYPQLGMQMVLPASHVLRSPVNGGAKGYSIDCFCGRREAPKWKHTLKKFQVYGLLSCWTTLNPISIKRISYSAKWRDICDHSAIFLYSFEVPGIW